MDGVRPKKYKENVKQAEDAYELYHGIHKAIVSEEMWYKVHAK